ncbi:hypothetical protein KKB43_02895 [Patescibacteria group bacterium]|nr:hypothetical protein [Patescibacteria group bacterium]
MANKKEELEYGVFFIERLNKIYGFDYKVLLNEEENKYDRDTDVYGISKSNSSDRIKIQIATNEKELKEIFAHQRNEIKKNGKISYLKCIDFDVGKWTSEAIARKENKYSNPEELILLITGISPLFNENNKDFIRKKFGNFDNSRFKGIYFANLPTIKENSNRPHDGQIIMVKSAFNDDRIVL